MLNSIYIQKSTFSTSSSLLYPKNFVPVTSKYNVTSSISFWNWFSPSKKSFYVPSVQSNNNFDNNSISVNNTVSNTVTNSNTLSKSNNNDTNVDCLIKQSKYNVVFNYIGVVFSGLSFLNIPYVSTACRFTGQILNLIGPTVAFTSTKVVTTSVSKICGSFCSLLTWSKPIEEASLIDVISNVISDETDSILKVAQQAEISNIVSQSLSVAADKISTGSVVDAAFSSVTAGVQTHAGIKAFNSLNKVINETGGDQILSTDPTAMLASVLVFCCTIGTLYCIYRFYDNIKDIFVNRSFINDIAKLNDDDLTEDEKMIIISNIINQKPDKE